jgi:hypothetical protein
LAICAGFVSPWHVHRRPPESGKSRDRGAPRRRPRKPPLESALKATRKVGVGHVEIIDGKIVVALAGEPTANRRQRCGARSSAARSWIAGVKPPSRAVTRFHRKVATQAAAHWRSTAADREMSGTVYEHCEFVAEKRAAIEARGKWLTGLTTDAAANEDASRALVA